MSDELRGVPGPAAEQRAEEGERRPLRRRPPRFSNLALSLSTRTYADDNVFRTREDKTRAFVVEFTPGARLDGRWGKHRFNVGYRGKYRYHDGLASENTLNHDFTAKGDLDLHRKFQASVEAGLEFGSDGRGDPTNRLVPAGSKPDSWRQHRLKGKVLYGRRIAKAQIGLAGDLTGTRYGNNGQAGRDHDKRGLTLTGRWNYRPRLAFLAEIRGTDIDYLDPASPLDSFELEPRLGIAWEATAKTSGEIKVGLLRKEFDDGSQQGFSGRSWDARVNWAPKSYSKGTAFASRSAQESGQGSGTAITDTYGVKWSHGFTKQLTLDAHAERSESDLGGGSDSVTTGLGWGLVYRASRAVTLRGGWEFTDQDTTGSGGSGYEDRIYFFQVDVRGEVPIRP